MNAHQYVHRRPARTREIRSEFKLRPAPMLAHFCDRNIRREVKQEFREARQAGRNG